MIILSFDLKKDSILSFDLKKDSQIILISPHMELFIIHKGGKLFLMKPECIKGEVIEIKDDDILPFPYKEWGLV